jgi:hypothetical protein
MLEYVVRCVELIRVFSQVDYFVRSGMAVGLGTGLASSMAIRYMGEKLKDGSLREILGVPMTSMSAVEAAKAGVPLATFQDYPQVHEVAFHFRNSLQSLFQAQQFADTVLFVSVHKILTILEF